MKLIDLSQHLENTEFSDPPGMGPKIVYRNHKETPHEIVGMFPGLRAEQMPGGEGWSYERLDLITHNGTHLDAPYHYHSTMDGGARAITIDEVPLEWCLSDAVKLDFRNLPDGHVATADDVARELDRIGYALKPLDIVVINTGAGAHAGSRDYLARGCGMGREATLYLTERGVRVTGTDGWSWDAPFVATAKRFAETKNPDLIWEGHRAGMVRGYCHIEKMANLHLLPAFGFRIACFPIKVKGGSAGWCRPVAMLEEGGR